METLKKLEGNLKKLDYNYKIIDEKELLIFSDFKIEISVKFINNKVIIKDSIKGWNPVSGFITSSINKIFKKTTITLVVCFIVFEILKIYRDFNPNTYLIIFGFWEIMWNCFYLVKITALKDRVIKWVE